MLKEEEGKEEGTGSPVSDGQTEVGEGRGELRIAHDLHSVDEE